MMSYSCKRQAHLRIDQGSAPAVVVPGPLQRPFPGARGAGWGGDATTGVLHLEPEAES